MGTIDTIVAPTVQVIGNVSASIDKVWELYRPFGEMDKWWHIYGFMKLLPPGKDEIGAIRNFQTLPDKNVYQERLVERDDENHSLRYDLVMVAPSVPTLNGIATIVSMRAVSEAVTEVTWRAWVDAGRMVIGMIKQVQAPGYQSGIEALDRYFNPSLGKVHVKVEAASNLPSSGDGIIERFIPPSPYVMVELNGAQHQNVTPVHASHSPIFGKTVTLDVLDKEGSLGFSVFESRLGHDLLVGHATVDLHTLEDGVPKSLSLPVEGSANATLAVQLTLQLSDGESRLGPTASQAHVDALEHMASIVDAAKAKVMAIVGNMLTPETARWEYDTYPIDPMPRMVKGLPRSQALSPKKTAAMVERLLEYAFSQIGTPARLAAADPASLAKYDAFFGDFIPPPEYTLAHWQDDAELCRQLVQGLNPMLITRVEDKAAVPDALRSLAAQGKGVEELIADKRLFMVDYRDLLGLEQKAPMFFYAPILLVYKELLDGGESRLNILGIQLDREGGPVYTPGSKAPNRYLLAKMHVACADNQVHQFIWHLGLAHLGVEPMAVAAHNQLIQPGHPLGAFLAPHFVDTLGINFLARQTLVAQTDAITDNTFALGTAQGVEIVSRAWKEYDFFGMSFPEQLLARGFDRGEADGLSGYLFRDDGYRIWDALGRYTLGTVSALYANDAAVAADPAIQAWAAESSRPDGAYIKGFPHAIGTRQLLADCLRVIVWTASAMHSTLNYPQYPYTATPLNRAASMYKPMPEGTDDIDASFLLEAMPPSQVALFQGMFSWLLSTPSEATLLGFDAVGAAHPEVHQAFQAELAEIGKIIAQRNQQLRDRGLPEYTYLLPANIAASINI